MKDSVIDGKWHTSQRCLLDTKDFNFCKKSNISLLLAGGKRRSARVWPSEEAQWSAARGVYNCTGFHFYRNLIISFLPISLPWHSDICTPQFLISFKILLTGSCHWGQGLLLLQVKFAVWQPFGQSSFVNTIYSNTNSLHSAVLWKL